MAAGELLATRPPWEISVHELVGGAGTSVGAFYTRFDDKTVAFAYAHRRFWERIEEAWAEVLSPAAWTGASAVEIAATLLRLHVRSWLADGDRLRGFLRLAATSTDPDLRLGIARLDRSIAAQVGTLLAGAGSPGDAETTAKRSEEAFRIVLSSLREVVLLRPRIAPSSREARDLVLVLTRSFFRGNGLGPVPGSYEEVLRVCARGPVPWSG